MLGDDSTIVHNEVAPLSDGIGLNVAIDGMTPQSQMSSILISSMRVKHFNDWSAAA